MLAGAPEPLSGVPVARTLPCAAMARACPRDRALPRPSGQHVRVGEPVATLCDIFDRPIGDGRLRSQHDGWIVSAEGVVRYPGEAVLVMAVRQCAPRRAVPREDVMSPILVENRRRRVRLVGLAQRGAAAPPPPARLELAALGLACTLAVVIGIPVGWLINRVNEAERAQRGRCATSRTWKTACCRPRLDALARSGRELRLAPWFTFSGRTTPGEPRERARRPCSSKPERPAHTRIASVRARPARFDSPANAPN
jgi:hypothetical protein